MPAEQKHPEVSRLDSESWPRCHVCQKPCDKASVVRMPRAVLFRAECHGDLQETPVTMMAFARAMDNNDPVIWGVAFHPGGEPLVTTRKEFFGKVGRLIRDREIVDHGAAPGLSFHEPGSGD